MPPKAKKKAAPKAKAPAADRKYAYLPQDLQRAAQHMDRVACIRQLQRSQADRQYKHVSSQTGSELSSTGAVDLAGKIDLVKSELSSAIAGLGSSMGGMQADISKIYARTAPPIPRRYRRPEDEPVFQGSYTIGGSTGSARPMK